MSNSPKAILFAVGGVVGVLVPVGAVVLLVLGVNSKRHVQTLASDALGMEVNVGGATDIGFFPSFHIAIN